MKEAKEFLPLISLDIRQSEILIELIQKDAYNQALNDVEVNIEPEIHESEGFKYPSINRDSIRKLKKQ